MHVIIKDDLKEHAWRVCVCMLLLVSVVDGCLVSSFTFACPLHVLCGLYLSK